MKDRQQLTIFNDLFTCIITKLNNNKRILNWTGLQQLIFVHDNGKYGILGAIII